MLLLSIGKGGDLAELADEINEDGITNMNKIKVGSLLRRRMISDGNFSVCKEVTTTRSD